MTSVAHSTAGRAAASIPLSSTGVVKNPLQSVVQRGLLPSTSNELSQRGLAAKECVCLQDANRKEAFTKHFLALFPQATYTNQCVPVHYQVLGQNKSSNQWDRIQKFIKRHPHGLSEKLEHFLRDRLTPDEVRALLCALKKALTNEDSYLFDLFADHGLTKEVVKALLPEFSSDLLFTVLKRIKALGYVFSEDDIASLRPRITSSVLRESLESDDSSDYDLLVQLGFKLTEGVGAAVSEFSSVEVDFVDRFFTALKRTKDAGYVFSENDRALLLSKITPAVLMIALLYDSSVFDLFIQCGYKLTEEDVRAVSSEFFFVRGGTLEYSREYRTHVIRVGISEFSLDLDRTVDRFFAALRRIKAAGYVFTENDIALLLYTTFDCNSVVHLVNMIKIIGIEKLTSTLVDKVLGHEQIQNGDSPWIREQKCCYAISAIINCGYPPNSKIFQSVVKLRPLVDMMEMLSCFFEKEEYDVTHEDFKAVIDQNDRSLIRQMTTRGTVEGRMLDWDFARRHPEVYYQSFHCGGYIPTETDLVHALNTKASFKVIYEILENGHETNPSVFPKPPDMYALGEFIFELPTYLVRLNFNYHNLQHIEHAYHNRESKINGAPCYTKVDRNSAGTEWKAAIKRALDLKINDLRPTGLY